MGSMSGAVVFHAVAMTLILFIAFPVLLYHFVRKNPKNDFRFRMGQMICTILIIAIGSYASYVYSSHVSLHAILGLIMMCLVMPIWTLLQHADVDSLKTCYL